MTRFITSFILLYVLTLVAGHKKIPFSPRKRYTADWASLDSRPNPEWYDYGKIGIFVHWGVFSVPAHACNDGAGEWYWANWKTNLNGCDAAWHNKTYGADFEYQQFGPMFKAQLFDPEKWAKLFKKSGAKYVVLTTKHHEGWTNFPSPQAWNWNSVDVGPHKDLTGLLTAAVKKEGLKMGLYHSLFEWYHPLYLRDKANNYTTTTYIDEVLQPQLRQIVNDYKPSVIWADGDWETDDSYWKSKEFLAWLFNDSPSRDDVIVNDRWGQGDRDVHGGVFTGEDRYNPNGIQPHKWENCFTLDGGSWGYNRDAVYDNYLTIEQILHLTVSGIAKYGNVLMNVGPTSDGIILPIFEERLTQLGQWLEISGESIYGSSPWRIANDNITDIETWYTTNNGDLYMSFMPWPSTGVLNLIEPVPKSDDSSVLLLGYGDKPLVMEKNTKGITVQLPNDVFNVKQKWMYTLRMVGFQI